MLCAADQNMLASMSETSWSDPAEDMGALPTTTVTLLLAEVGD